MCGVRTQRLKPVLILHTLRVRGNLAPNSNCLALILSRKIKLVPNSLPNRALSPHPSEVIM